MHSSYHEQEYFANLSVRGLDGHSSPLNQGVSTNVCINKFWTRLETNNDYQYNTTYHEDLIQVRPQAVE